MRSGAACFEIQYGVIDKAHYALPSFFKHTGLQVACALRVGRVVFSLLWLIYDCRPVVDRRLRPFLASPRKGRKRRRRKVAALRVKKWGTKQTRFAQTSFIPDPFSAQHKRQRHMRKANINTSVVRFSPLHTRNVQAHRATAIRCCF
jgi:hypothetical protein